MKTFSTSLLFATLILFAACKKDSQQTEVWYSYQELDCNLTPFATTSDSAQNFKNLTAFLADSGVHVLYGYSKNHGAGWALQVCGGPRHNGFTHYVRIKTIEADRAAQLLLKKAD